MSHCSRDAECLRGGARLTIARGPLELAVNRGVALLPVSVIEVEPFASFEVGIGSEIRPPSSHVGDPIECMALAYARYLLPLAKAHPEQWDWSNINPLP